MQPLPSPASERLFQFIGHESGPWRILDILTISGEIRLSAPALRVIPGGEPLPGDGFWRLAGVVANERYVERAEKNALAARQEGLGRPESTRAVLIPIRKSPAWWTLTQDERRDLFEARSNHIALGLQYLPAIARRLHHCRDLGWAEPFDFLTWFEFAPEDEPAFDRLTSALRATPEWEFVDREVEFRLERAAPAGA